MAVPFISRQDLTDYLGHDVTTDDGALIAVDAACDVVRDIAEQPFNRVTGGTAVLDGSGTDCLVLPNQPVARAGTVVVNGSAVTDYVLDDGMLFRGTVTPGGSTYYDGEAVPRVWPAGRRNVTVTYDHGYADDDIPRSVRMVALQVAARLIVQGVAMAETQGDQSIRYATAATDLTEGEKMILRKYRTT